VDGRADDANVGGGLMGFGWVSTEARTGEIIDDLQDLNVTSVKQTIGQYESTTATLPIDTQDATPGWQRATQRGATHLILLDDNPSDPAHGIPSIGYGIIRNKPDHTDLLALDIATCEAYLDRRYINDDLSYTNVGQNDIAADLINRYVLDGASGLNGIPIRVQYTTAGSGQQRTLTTWKAASDKTVYSALTELSGLEGGPEWYIGWEWQHNPERITPVFYVGDRVGAAAPAGLGPAATFEMPGPVTSFKFVDDYSAGKGANSVIATSTAQGNTRPQSPAQTASDPSMPTFEYRWSPSTSITDVSTLTSHAGSALTNMQDGAVSVAMTANSNDAPLLGVDYHLGDDIGIVVVAPAWPDGLEGTARMVSYERTLGMTPTITPALVNATFTTGM
jgi:hypothetical protein